MITQWLETFKSAWLRKDIPAVLDLFSDNVEYWETPFKQLHGKEQIRQEWQAITTQERIELMLQVFASIDNRHTVIWTLQYVTPHGTARSWAGTYLITLNENGACTYFYQAGEQQDA